MDHPLIYGDEYVDLRCLHCLWGFFFFFFSVNPLHSFLRLFYCPIRLTLNTTSTALLTLSTRQCLLHMPVQPTKVIPRSCCCGGTRFARGRFSKATHNQDTVSASHPKSRLGRLGSFMEIQFPDGHWLKFDHLFSLYSPVTWKPKASWRPVWPGSDRNGQR